MKISIYDQLVGISTLVDLISCLMSSHHEHLSFGVYKLWKMEVEDGRIKFDVPIIWFYLKRRNARWVALMLISWVKMKTVRMQRWNCEVICQQLQTRVIKNRIRSKNQEGKVNFIFPIE